MYLESRPTLFSDLAALSVTSGAHLEHCADPPIPAVAGWVAGIHRRTHSHAHTHLRDSNQPTVYVFGLWEGTGENPHRPWENMQTPHVTYSVQHRWGQRIGIPPGNFRCIFKSFFLDFIERRSHSCPLTSWSGSDWVKIQSRLFLPLICSGIFIYFILVKCPLSELHMPTIGVDF